MNEILGLISGNGKLPSLLLDEAKKAGYRVALCAIAGETDPEVASKADFVEWVRLGQLGRLIKFFKAAGVERAVMGGKITKTNLLRGEVRPDLDMVKALMRTRNHSDDSLLGAVCDYLGSKGIKILETTALLSKEVLPAEGVISKRKPSEKEKKDIEFGWRLAKEMGRLDVGQTVVVKNQAVLAVEAIEGTDEAILRGGSLGSGGVTVVKAAKPNQDMRFDVPTVGLATMAALIQAKANVLAFEAGKTILLDRDRFIERADEMEIVVAAYGD